MSFAFFPEVQVWDESGDIPLRKIRKASLYDVSVVTTPAYAGTEIALRSLTASRVTRSSIPNKRRAMEMKLRGLI
jgi:phage head maturation protease